MTADTCPATTRVKRSGCNHTIRCQKPAGHDATAGNGDGHEAKDDGRLTIWYGDVRPLPTNERYRFGLDPHWMMKRGGAQRDGGDGGVW